MTDSIKFTQKEMFDAIATVFTGGNLPESMTAQDVVDFCDARVAALAKRAEKSKEYAAKKRAANDELLEVVYGVLDSTPATIDDIVARLEANGVSESRAKVTNRLSKLAGAERAVKSEISIPADKDAGTKARKVVAYSLA